MQQKMSSEAPISISLQYPYNDKYEYKTMLKRIDLDKQREIDIKSGKGFIITAPKGIKNDIKNQDGIFSSRYGSNSITDTDSFSGRYRCKCGLKRGSINHGEFCTTCNTKVQYVDDDVSITGYLVLKDEYLIIHPNLYCSLEAFIGATRLTNIIKPEVPVDSDGNEIAVTPMKKNEPFNGIGLIEFYNRFYEIMNFYLSKYPAKVRFYNDIMENRDILWTHTIAVYSSLLRPSSLDNGSLRYEACNDQFNMLAKLVYEINDNGLGITRKKKERLRLLYDIQYNLNAVYIAIRDILSKKKGKLNNPCMLPHIAVM